MWSLVLVWLGRDTNVTVGFEGLETMRNRTEIGGVMNMWVTIAP